MGRMTGMGSALAGMTATILLGILILGITAAGFLLAIAIAAIFGKRRRRCLSRS